MDPNIYHFLSSIRQSILSNKIYKKYLKFNFYIPHYYYYFRVNEVQRSMYEGFEPKYLVTIRRIFTSWTNWHPHILVDARTHSPDILHGNGLHVLFEDWSNWFIFSYTNIFSNHSCALGFIFNFPVSCVLNYPCNARRKMKIVYLDKLRSGVEHKISVRINVILYSSERGAKVGVGNIVTSRDNYVHTVADKVLGPLLSHHSCHLFCVFSKVL